MVKHLYLFNLVQVSLVYVPIDQGFKSHIYDNKGLARNIFFYVKVIINRYKFPSIKSQDLLHT